MTECKTCGALGGLHKRTCTNPVLGIWGGGSPPTLTDTPMMSALADSIPHKFDCLDRREDGCPCKEARMAQALSGAWDRHVDSMFHITNDMEAHIKSFNEGYEAAVTQGLADDPTLADDWFQEKIRAAKADAWDRGRAATFNDPLGMAFGDITNPYRKAQS